MDDLEYYHFSDTDVGTFAIDVLRPDSWLEQAEGLLESASILAPELERRWSDHLDLRKLHRVFLMLCGFAVENFCKAVIAVRLSEDQRERVRTGGDLPSAFKTHELQKLLENVRFVVPPKDDRLVKKLEIAVTWWGRYPAPVAPSHLHPKTARGAELWPHSMGSDEIRTAVEFVQRVNSFVRANI